MDGWIHGRIYPWPAGGKTITCQNHIYWMSFWWFRSNHSIPFFLRILLFQWWWRSTESMTMMRQLSTEIQPAWDQIFWQWRSQDLLNSIWALQVNRLGRRFPSSFGQMRNKQLIHHAHAPLNLYWLNSSCRYLGEGPHFQAKRRKKICTMGEIFRTQAVTLFLNQSLFHLSRRGL